MVRYQERAEKNVIHISRCSISNVKSIDQLHGLDPCVTSSKRRAAAVPFAAAAFSPPDRLFHAAPTVLCVSI